MSWVVAGVAIGTAALGAYQGNQQRKAQEKANKQQGAITAAQQEASPWTDMKPQEYRPEAVTGDALGGAVQGGMSGAMQGYSIKKGMREDAAAEEAAKQAKADKERQEMMLLMNSGQRPS
jgi:hypothetical protein